MDELLHWRGRELFLGGIYVGEVQRIVPEKWREYKWLIPGGDPNINEAVRVAKVRHHETHEAKPWRCWFMSQDDGEALPNMYATEGGAMTALLNAARAAISSGQLGK